MQTPLRRPRVISNPKPYPKPCSNPEREVPGLRRAAAATGDRVGVFGEAGWLRIFGFGVLVFRL